MSDVEWRRMRLGIVADDITGACDAAGPFGAFGHARVVLDVSRIADAREADVVAVDLNVREHVDAQTVAFRAEAAAQAVADQKRRVLLKIDSTLRGPVAALVDGALAGSDASVAVIAPAFPAQGRFVRKGRLELADGTIGARVADVLGSGETLGAIGEDAAQTPEALAHAVANLVARGVRRVMVDASGTETLRALALAWQNRPEWLLVGSAGLAREVAAAQARPDTGAGVHMTGARDASAGVPTRPAPDARSVVSTETRCDVLVVAGSPTAATRAQVAVLAAAEARASQPDAIAHLEGEWLQPPRISVMATENTEVRDAGEASHSLARTVADRAAHGHRPHALVIAGGATARAVCDALAVHSVLIHGELEPGVPHGRLQGGIWHDLPVVTKAGAFGRETALLDAARALGVSCEGSLRSTTQIHD